MHGVQFYIEMIYLIALFAFLLAFESMYLLQNFICLPILFTFFLDCEKKVVTRNYSYKPNSFKFGRNQQNRIPLL